MNHVSAFLWIILDLLKCSLGCGLAAPISFSVGFGTGPLRRAEDQLRLQNEPRPATSLFSPLLSGDQNLITALPTTLFALSRSRYSLICSNAMVLMVWRILS